MMVNGNHFQFDPKKKKTPLKICKKAHSPFSLEANLLPRLQNQCHTSELKWQNLD
jgi:hypothetical protein